MVLKGKAGDGELRKFDKVHVTLRLDRHVLAFFRDQGRGWTSRINEALKKFIADARGVGDAGGGLDG